MNDFILPLFLKKKDKNNNRQNGGAIALIFI